MLVRIDNIAVADNIRGQGADQFVRVAVEAATVTIICGYAVWPKQAETFGVLVGASPMSMMRVSLRCDATLTPCWLRQSAHCRVPAEPMRALSFAASRKRALQSGAPARARCRKPYSVPPALRAPP